MTDEKFEKATIIKENLKVATNALNLLKGGCDVILKAGETEVKVNDNKVIEDLMNIYSSKVDDLQREFGWL
ncbi:MAG: hypothetical protein K2N48_01430 [Muribaculaceae bacterium]|nr:hypothetical protein [Muribaculaceae bacterium]